MERVLGQFEEVHEIFTATPGAQAWQARDGLNGRSVLIKRLPIGNSHKTRATQALALAHPNIVPTRGWLRDGDALFVVRDYILGVNLRQALSDVRRRAFGRLQSLLTPILDALDYAHRFGLSHGGVTPENVLIDPSGLSMLCDFATIEGSSRAHEAYVPHALLSGDGKSTPQSDFYALCELYKEFLPARSPEDEAGSAARQRLLRNLSETQQTAANAEELRYKLDAVAKMADLLGFSAPHPDDGALLRPARLVCSVSPPTATLAPGGGSTINLALANDGDRPLHVESVTSNVVWLNLPTRQPSFTLSPDERRDLIWTLSGARLLPGAYVSKLTIRSNSGIAGERPLEGMSWDEQTVTIPTMVTGAPVASPAAAEALEEPLLTDRSSLVDQDNAQPASYGMSSPEDEHPGIAVTQEPDPGLARTGQNGVLHLGVKNIGSRRIRIEQVMTYPSWLTYPGSFQALWIEPGATQYLGFSIVTASLPGGDYTAHVTFVTSVLKDTLLGPRPIRRELTCGVRVRIVRGLADAQPGLDKAAGLGCIPMVLGIISAGALGICLAHLR